MKRERAFRKIKTPVEFHGDLAGSLAYQWKQEGRVVSLVLVFARGSGGTDVRLYWRLGGGLPIDVSEAKDVSIRNDESLPGPEELAMRLRVHDHAVVEGHSLVRAGFDAWYPEEFPPRERIRPLMTQQAVVEEMKIVDPSMLSGRWEGNGAWDNWATVDIYGGPLSAEDATYACARPIATLMKTLEGLMLPACKHLMAS